MRFGAPVDTRIDESHVPLYAQFKIARLDLQLMAVATPRRRLSLKAPPASAMSDVPPKRCSVKPCKETSETSEGVYPDGKDNEKGRFGDRGGPEGTLLQRLWAAHLNHCESFAPFAASVAAASSLAAPTKTVAELGI